MEGSGSPVKEEKLPPGFRFHPTDEELITYYLVNKISDPTFTGRAIGDVDLNKCEPWDLPGKAKMGEKEWYFFSLRDRKYPTGVRTNRATNTGYWKTTGKDKEIYNSNTAELVGMKKTLVFYRGRAPRGEKTNWVMHEYRIHSKSSYRTNKQDEWVVCRVFQKSAGGKKFPSNHSSSRAALNPFSYNLVDVPPNPMQSHSHIIHPHPHPTSTFNHYITPAEIQELNKVFSTASTSLINFPAIPQQVNYGSGFTISGLNLNLGGLREAAAEGMTQQDEASTMLNGGVVMGGDDAGYGGEMMSGNRFVPMDQCGGDLDTYWPYS